jgi:hypothetical protein
MEGWPRDPVDQRGWPRSRVVVRMGEGYRDRGPAREPDVASMREDLGVAVRSLPATIAVAALAAVALAGCADDPETARPVTCSSDGPTAGKPTAPGMLLCVGTAGHVPLTDRRDRHHVVRVTVTAVDRVPRAEVDFLSTQDLGTDVDPANIDIYAVHALARLSEPADLDPLRDLLLYSRERDFADPHVLSTWAPDRCVHRTFTPGIPAGTTIRTCDWVWVTRGADLTGVTIGSEINDYAVYGGNPVSWSLRDQ